MDTEAFDRIVRERRAVFTPMFSGEPVPEDLIRRMLENAHWAPSHKRTEPWRFHVYRGEAKQRLADLLAQAYTNITPAEQFSETARDKPRSNVLRADTVIVIVMQRDPKESVPEWEEIAAMGAAVQNLWLSASAYGLAGYWGTPGTVGELGRLLDLPEGQRCLGLFLLGRPAAEPPAGTRGPLEDKVSWHEH